MLAEPPGSVVVVKEALPADRDAVPSSVDPFRNCTDPVGTPVVADAIVTLKVILWPVLMVEGDAVS